MAFDFAAVKARARRVVHDTMAVDAEYLDDSLAAPEPLRIRWHNKIVQGGDLEDAGYSMMIEGVDRVIFDQAELLLKAVEIQRGGKLRLLAPQYNGAILIMGEREPEFGPVEQIWFVGRA